MRRIFLAVIFMVLAPGVVCGAEPTTASVQEAEKWSYTTLPKPAADTTQQPAAQTDGDADEKYFWDRREERQFKYNALIALSCTTVILYLFAAIMLFRLSERAKGQHLIHLTSLALIIYGTLTLALLPTTSDGLTAPIGILGALAGYLFGHASPKSGGSSREDKD
jgi:hypothetical protein